MSFKSERRGMDTRAAAVEPAVEYCWSVTCPFCDAAAGRASGVTDRGFFWTCGRCGRTELVLMAAERASTQPASVELWRLTGAAHGPVAAAIVLRPAEGFELRVTRGRRLIRSEIYDDPNALLLRSGEIRRLIEQGRVGYWKAAN
jgi:hypothetical protein